jgi:hypothetical protein
MSTKSYSTEELIEAIDDHPLRWEVITLESALSLPTLSIKDAHTHIEFFFYPVGGPINNRQIWPPYYRVISSLSDLENIEYQPIQPHELAQAISPDEPLGAEILDNQPRDEYESQLKTLYALTDRLVEIYPKPIETQSDADRQVIENFRQHFHQIIQQPLLPAYKILNPDFFKWLEQARN